ncbi:MAG TPA: phosphotransferase [Ktedonobacteraceae bacterium]|jgi:aminoglycoside phosphotransferase (APT) family kinase protein|nr:phosphotransferase [Ktedonobacteraceae bacterium]
MGEKKYSERLGMIADTQFQAALDRFHLGRLVQAEPVPFGLFGQNVFVSSTNGEYVLRGQPHFSWQFPTEQFYTRLLHERTHVPVPWPYLIDPTSDIFGWNFVIMPRMPGFQLADEQATKQLGSADRRGIAQALGENLVHMQEVTWPIAGRYNAVTDAVEPFELAQELAWPFPVESDTRLASMTLTTISYSERVKACLRHHLTRAYEYNSTATTLADISWVEELIVDAEDALNEQFEPCLLMEDYKEGNLVVMQDGERWQVSGVFDLMEAHFGDGEADLSRPIGEYLNEDSQLASEFFAAYRKHKALRPEFARRFPIYMLLDRVILWAFFQRQGWCWWDEHWTFRDWASQYISPNVIFDQL